MLKPLELTLTNSKKNSEPSEMPKLLPAAPPNSPRSRESGKTLPETSPPSTRKRELELSVLSTLDLEKDPSMPELNSPAHSEDNLLLIKRLNVSRKSERDKLTSPFADTVLKLDKAIFKSSNLYYNILVRRL